GSTWAVLVSSGYIVLLLTRRPPSSPLFPTRRSSDLDLGNSLTTGQPVAYEIKTRLPASAELTLLGLVVAMSIAVPLGIFAATRRSEEHTSELQSRGHLVCRLLLEKKKIAYPRQAIRR